MDFGESFGVFSGGEESVKVELWKSGILGSWYFEYLMIEPFLHERHDQIKDYYVHSSPIVLDDNKKTAPECGGYAVCGLSTHPHLIILACGIAAPLADFALSQHQLAAFQRVCSKVVFNLELGIPFKQVGYSLA